MADKSFFGRLQKLFSTNAVVRRVGTNRLKVIDVNKVQSNSGLNAFRIVMDETNNTPDVVDRNQLVGQIFIQPTKTAEFIVLDFVVQPSGAAFED